MSATLTETDIDSALADSELKEDTEGFWWASLHVGGGEPGGTLECSGLTPSRAQSALRGVLRDSPALVLELVKGAHA